MHFIHYSGQISSTSFILILVIAALFCTLVSYYFSTNLGLSAIIFKRFYILYVQVYSAKLGGWYEGHIHTVFHVSTESKNLIRYSFIYLSIICKHSMSLKFTLSLINLLSHLSIYSVAHQYNKSFVYIIVKCIYIC